MQGDELWDLLEKLERFRGELRVSKDDLTPEQQKKNRENIRKENNKKVQKDWKLERTKDEPLAKTEKKYSGKMGVVVSLDERRKKYSKQNDE